MLSALLPVIAVSLFSSGCTAFYFVLTRAASSKMLRGVLLALKDILAQTITGNFITSLNRSDIEDLNRTVRSGEWR